ncbi:MAG: sulfatase [Chloroflexi bacterium]|nr:sulfatase [Chloroflexota bacterium]
MKVLYLDLDSLRRDHLGCYGYARPTTPNIDRIARDGARFTNMYAADTPCVPARASIFTGRWGIRTGLLTHGPRGEQIGSYGAPPDRAGSSAQIPQLQQHLSAQLGPRGLRTAVVSTFADQAPWFTRGWESYFRPRWDLHAQHVEAPDINAFAIPWLREHARGDFFLYVHYWDPHTPYTAPQAYVDRMLRHELPSWLTDERIRHDVETYGDLPQTAKSLGILNRRDFDRWLAMYDAEIAFCDEHVGQLLDILESTGVLDDTLVLISTDHGENQGEHGVYGDHWGTFETDAHIWLVARWPNGGITPGTLVDAACYTMDIGPTLCEVGGLNVPTGWQGRSFLGLARGGVEPEPKRDYVVLEHGLWSAQRAFCTVGRPGGDWKLIKSYHGGLFDWPLTQLFDQNNDPREEIDVSAARPDVLEELERRLRTWEEAQLGGRPDPLREVAAEGPHAVRWAHREFAHAVSSTPTRKVSSVSRIRR